MGLDMYAYAAARAGQNSDYWEQSYIQENLNEDFSTVVTKPRELAYWRKHPNLHGWMNNLWLEKNTNSLHADVMFNGIELELTWDDLDRLEQDITYLLLQAFSLAMIVMNTIRHKTFSS